MQQYNEFNKDIIQYRYYIHEFWSCKTSQHYKLLINLSDKINSKISEKHVFFSNFSVYYA